MVRRNIDAKPRRAWLRFASIINSVIGRKPLQQLARYTFAIVSPSRVIFIGVIAGLALSLGFVSCNTILSMMIVISLFLSTLRLHPLAQCPISHFAGYDIVLKLFIHSLFIHRVAEIVRAACTVALLLIIIVISRIRSPLCAL